MEFIPTHKNSLLISKSPHIDKGNIADIHFLTDGDSDTSTLFPEASFTYDLNREYTITHYLFSTGTGPKIHFLNSNFESITELNRTGAASTYNILELDEEIEGVRYVRGINNSPTTTYTISEINVWGSLPSIEKVLFSINSERILTYDFSSNSWKSIFTRVPSEQDYIDFGLEKKNVELIPERAWKELQGRVLLLYYTDDSDKNEILIETETEPFTIYDEMGDSMEVLYYTDDLDKEEAELEITANYSPLDELEDEFELVTWTNDGSEDTIRTVNLSAIPHPQLLLSREDVEMGEIKSVLLNSNISNSGDIKVLVSPDSGETWRGKYLVNITDILSIRANGFTPEEFNDLTKEELANLFPNGKARFSFYLEKEIEEDIVEIYSLSINEKVYTMTPSIHDLSIVYELLELKSPKLFISRDDGQTWKKIEQDQLTTLEDLPEGNQMRVKIVLTDGQELYGLSYSWI